MPELASPLFGFKNAASIADTLDVNLPGRNCEKIERRTLKVQHPPAMQNMLG
jgi:hypothetical protein